jgi:hypothetical protein
VVFAVDLAHAWALESLFNAYIPTRAKTIWGEQDRAERRDILGDFMAGKFEILISVQLLTYGWDAPPVSCVVMARPTCSRALYCQSIGRGLRPHPGKKDCLVLDIVGNTELHTMVTPDSALEGDEELHERSLRPQKRWPDSISDLVDDELQPDPEPLEPVAPLGYRIAAVDGQLMMVDIDPGERQQDSAPATAAQVDYLVSLGLDTAELLSAEQASHVLNQLAERREAGFCSLKQALFLQRKCLNPNVTKAKADEAIQKIADNHWRVPHSMLLDEELVYSGTKTLVMKGGRA